MRKLFKAIRQNDLETVKDILSRNPAAVNCLAEIPPKKDEGQSPLQVAIKTGNLDIANYLINQGADVGHMEPDKGLPPTRCYRCPVLFDAIMRLFSRWEDDRQGYMQLIARLLELGADPNQSDNRGFTSWDMAIAACCEHVNTIKGDREAFTSMTKELLDTLLKYGAEILDMDRIEQRLTGFESYSLFLKSLILNCDVLQGFNEEQARQWNKRWSFIEPVIRPYYAKNNPAYQDDAKEKGSTGMTGTAIR